MKHQSQPYDSIVYAHRHAWVWNPMGAYDNYSFEFLQEMAGLIPFYFDRDDAEQLTAKGIIEQGYARSSGGFCMWQGGAIDAFGVYTNDHGDPPLSPVVATSHGDDLVYIYEYGLVGVLNVPRAEASIARCD